MPSLFFNPRVSKKSGHRYGIVARVWSPPHPEEIDAAGTEPTQGHLLQVEQAEDGLDKAEEGEGGAENN